MRKILGFLTITVLILALGGTSSLAQPPSPPPQPASGPGGSDYSHTAIAVRGPYYVQGHLGEVEYSYFIYEPDAPKPPTAPVILFLHGWGGLDPTIYGDWIRHIVKKGYVVVQVQYQTLLSPPSIFTPNAMETWWDAIKRLTYLEDHVRPERDGDGRLMTAMVGHSVGGLLAANMASKIASEGNSILIPYALVLIEPGILGIVPGEDFSKIHPDTKILTVIGDEDNVVCKATGLEIWNNTPQVSDMDKDFLLVQSDSWGEPAQIANHDFPNTNGHGDTAAVDARDFFITYKLSVAAFNCAFRGTDCEYAFGNGSAQQVDMGQWSDGQPVTPMLWAADPNVLETTCQDPQVGGFRRSGEQGFGDRQNSAPWAMQWWNDKLYVGTVRAWNCWSTAALERFVQQFIPWIHLYPPDDPDLECTPEAKDLPLQAEIWTWTPTTDTWDLVYQSPEDVEIPEHPGSFVARDIGFRGMTVFTEPDMTEALYVAGNSSQAFHGDNVPPPRILRSTDGVVFEPIPQDPGTFLGEVSKAGFRGMTSYNGRFYVVHCNVNGEGPVFESSDPKQGNDSFRQITPEGMEVFELAAFNGFLYIGTFDTANGYSVLKTDATGDPPYTFIPVVVDGGYLEPKPNKSVVSMKEFNGSLYVGTGRQSELIRIHADDTWDLIVGAPRDTPDGLKEPLSGYGPGFDWMFNGHIWRMEEHNGVLYVGTMDASTERKDNPLGTALQPLMGFDLFATRDGVNYTNVTRNGLGDMFSIGVRTMASTPYDLFLGAANPYYGLQIWRGSKEPKEPEQKPTLEAPLCFGIDSLEMKTHNAKSHKGGKKGRKGSCKRGKCGDEITLKGSATFPRPIDLAIDDVTCTFDDGEDHTFSFFIPAGSFKAKGKPDRSKFKFRSERGSKPQIEAEFNVGERSRFKIRVKKLPGTNEITGTSLTVGLQVGSIYGDELLEVEKKCNRLKYKAHPRVDCSKEISSVEETNDYTSSMENLQLLQMMEVTNDYLSLLENSALPEWVVTGDYFSLLENPELLEELSAGDDMDLSWLWTFP